MAVITLSVPDGLKERMNGVDWVNWSSVARAAFEEKLCDLEELERFKRVQEISGISSDDKRVVRADVAAEAKAVYEKTSKSVKAGKIKSLSGKEFDKWCKDL